MSFTDTYIQYIYQSNVKVCFDNDCFYYLKHKDTHIYFLYVHINISSNIF